MTTLSALTNILPRPQLIHGHGMLEPFSAQILAVPKYHNTQHMKIELYNSQVDNRRTTIYDMICETMTDEIVIDKYIPSYETNCTQFLMPGKKYMSSSMVCVETTTTIYTLRAAEYR